MRGLSNFRRLLALRDFVYLEERDHEFVSQFDAVFAGCMNSFSLPPPYSVENLMTEIQNITELPWLEGFFDWKTNVAFTFSRKRQGLIDRFVELSQNGRAPTRLKNWMTSGLPDDDVETIHDYLKRSGVIM